MACIYLKRLCRVLLSLHANESKHRVRIEGQPFLAIDDELWALTVSTTTALLAMGLQLSHAKLSVTVHYVSLSNSSRLFNYE